MKRTMGFVLLVAGLVGAASASEGNALSLDLGSTRAIGFTGISCVDEHPRGKGVRLMAEQMLECLTGR